MQTSLLNAIRTSLGRFLCVDILNTIFLRPGGTLKLRFKNVVVINFIEFIETDILKTLIRTSLKKFYANIEEAIAIFKKLLLFLLLYLKSFTSIYLPIYLYMFNNSQY